MPKPAIPPTDGTRFGRGVVIGTGIRCGKQMRDGAILRCDCGQLYSVMLGHLRSGSTVSCGCRRREAARISGPANNTKHGLHSHPLYPTWQQMISRCGKPGHKDYPNYGGRGITVFEPWLDVSVFLQWIDQNLGPRPAAMSLDRWPDNDGNYEPGNLRWATASEQRLHQRPRKSLTCGNPELGGVDMAVADRG